MYAFESKSIYKIHFYKAISLLIDDYAVDAHIYLTSGTGGTEHIWYHLSNPR